MKLITLFDLEVDIKYDYEGPQIGGSYSDTGEVEMLSASVIITSVISGGIEIISLIPKQQLLDLEQEILKDITNRN